MGSAPACLTPFWEQSGRWAAFHDRGVDGGPDCFMRKLPCTAATLSWVMTLMYCEQLPCCGHLPWNLKYPLQLLNTHNFFWMDFLFFLLMILQGCNQQIFFMPFLTPFRPLSAPLLRVLHLCGPKKHSHFRQCSCFSMYPKCVNVTICGLSLQTSVFTPLNFSVFASLMLPCSAKAPGCRSPSMWGLPLAGREQLSWVSFWAVFDDKWKTYTFQGLQWKLTSTIKLTLSPSATALKSLRARSYMQKCFALEWCRGRKW